MLTDRESRNLWSPPVTESDAALWLQTSTCASLTVILLLCVSAAILMISLGITQTAKEVPGPSCTAAEITTLVLNASACSHSSTCMVGYLDTDIDQCLFYPVPASTTCTSACYKTDTTHSCDGQGGCIGDTCKGTCSETSDCENIFSALNEVTDPSTGWSFANWSGTTDCVLGRCVYTVLDIYTVSTPAPLSLGNVTRRWRAGAAQYSCLDYIDSTIRTEQEDCLIYNRYLLTPDIVDYGTFSSGIFGNSTYPFQLSSCMITYGCATADVTFDASTMTERAAKVAMMTETPLRSMEAWGFIPIENRGTGELDNTFPGIDNPFMRNMFMAQMRDVITESMPKFTTTVENGVLWHSINTSGHL